MRCQFEHDDAAYVLGALSPTEREAYERHLETCASCRASMAEIAGVPGLLARLDPARAQRTLASPEAARHPTTDPATEVTPPPRVPETLLPQILRAAAAEQRRNRRRARWRTAITAAVAACLALVVGAGAGVVWQRPDDRVVSPPAPSSPPVIAMAPVSTASTGVGAELTLLDHPWGTEIRMWCRYQGSPRPGSYPRRYHYQLVAITKEGVTALLASWAARAGEREPEVTATTEYHRDELKQLELRRADGTPLLRYVLP